MHSPLADSLLVPRKGDLRPGGAVSAKAVPAQSVNSRQDAVLDIASAASSSVPHFPYFQREVTATNPDGHSSPVQGEILPSNPIDGFEFHRPLGHGLEPKPSWDCVFVAKAGPTLPMEEETWGR